jgi:hypothetical protein
MYCTIGVVPETGTTSNRGDDLLETLEDDDMLRFENNRKFT